MMNLMKRYFFDLCAGIGGFALGAYWAGIKFDGHYFSEVDEYGIRIYKKRFPKALELGDVRKINYAALPGGEWLVAGGFPCQPHSIAGKRKGAADERDLWPECARMLRELRPAIAVFENVPGLFISGGGVFFNGILQDISESGYDAEWQIISASGVGAPHRRERIWIAAYPQSERWGEIQARKNSAHSESGGKKYQKWDDVQFEVARNYSVKLRKGDESFVCGLDDGLPFWLDRLKCLGNAIVPQCAEVIFRLPVFDRWRCGEEG